MNNQQHGFPAGDQPEQWDQILDERQQQDSVGSQATQPYGTANYDNPTIDFSAKSGMPSNDDLAITGLR